MVSRFFFIHMAKFVTQHNDKCDACIGKIKFLKHKQKNYHQSIHNKPLSKVYIDTVTLSRTPRGMKYLLTIEDGFSRFLMAIPVPNKNAETLAGALLEKFVPVLGGSRSSCTRITGWSFEIGCGTACVRR